MAEPKTKITNLEELDLLKTVDVVNAQLKTLETFIARRFDEISMEINATAQQADMAESSMSEKFKDILEALSAINFSGSGDTAANTGVELETVIHQTEQAANTILDRADSILAHVGDSADWTDETAIKKAREAIANDVSEIVMACSFQDITGQRIRNTLVNLHDMEDKLNTTFQALGIEVKPDETKVAEKTKKGATQDDIDSLFD
ncbi:MAG: hypothetical protein GC137_06870 [Alphaproteobacteria bacterium]|nr:hypothetical protein [Alphaproteobacteria bacterium]